MTTLTIYIAVDGNRFDDQYRCQEYEKEILAMRQQVSTIRFFDKDRKWLTMPFIFEEKFEEILDNIFEELYEDDSFKKLINDFCIKTDDNIKKAVIPKSSLRYFWFNINSKNHPKFYIQA